MNWQSLVRLIPPVLLEQKALELGEKLVPMWRGVLERLLAVIEANPQWDRKAIIEAIRAELRIGDAPTVAKRISDVVLRTLGVRP